MSTAEPSADRAPHLAACAASFGLAHSRLEPPDEPLATSAWNQLAAQARRERQWGTLAWAIAQGWWPATDTQAEQASNGHRAAMAVALRIEQRLLELHDRCTERGIDLVVLKGPAVAHLDHAEPSLRSFGDLDLLVSGHDLSAVETLLVGHAGVRRFPEPRPGFDARFSKGLSIRLPDGVEIDLHRTLAVGPFGLRIDADELRGHTTTFELGGTSIGALDRRGRFLHACIHATLGSAVPALTARRDVAAIADTALDEAPLLAAIDLAETWGMGLVVAWAVHDAATTFDWLPTSTLRARIDHLHPAPQEWAWLDGYRGHRSSARHARDSLEALDSWGDRVSYALAALAPTERMSLARLRRAGRDLRRR